MVKLEFTPKPPHPPTKSMFLITLPHLTFHIFINKAFINKRPLSSQNLLTRKGKAISTCVVFTKAKTYREIQRLVLPRV